CGTVRETVVTERPQAHRQGVSDARPRRPVGRAAVDHQDGGWLRPLAGLGDPDATDLEDPPERATYHLYRARGAEDVTPGLSLLSGTRQIQNLMEGPLRTVLRFFALPTERR